MHLCSLLDRFLQQENSQGLYYGKYYPGNLDVLFQALDVNSIAFFDVIMFELVVNEISSITLGVESG